MTPDAIDTAAHQAGTAPDSASIRARATALADEARLQAERAWLRAQSYSVDPPRLGLGTVAVGLAALLLAGWLYGRHTAAIERARWREAIATASADVTAILAAKGQVIAGKDLVRVKIVTEGDADDEARFQARMRAIAAIPLSEACRVCRRPSQWMRHR